jgi:hypothetical protein
VSESISIYTGETKLRGEGGSVQRSWLGVVTQV